MSKPLLKSQILLGNKFLGSLFYFKDKHNRGCLKLSFKNKITQFTMWTDSPYLTNKLTLPESEEEVSFDISYKFFDNLLEIKRQSNKKIYPQFYKVPSPPNNLLFILKLKDWHILDDAKTLTDSLVINLPNNNNSVAIIFSFLGENGLPFILGEYLNKTGRTICADLPYENNYKKICIGTIEDTNNTEPYNLVIKIPYNPLNN